MPDLPISLMASRYGDLSDAYDAYRATGIALVAFSGGEFVPAGFSDDPGAYYLVPRLRETFDIGQRSAVILFLLFPLLAGVILGSIGWLIALESRVAMIAGVVGTLIGGAIALLIGDIYIFEFAVPVVVIPWMLCVRNSRLQLRWKAVAMFAAGVSIGTFATVRASAALPTLVFIVVLVAFREIRPRPVLAALLLAGLLLPTIYFRHLAVQRDHFLESTTGSTSDNQRHAFWHFAYLGLGFINNPYVPGGLCDDAAKATVREIAPRATYLSLEYSRILRGEVYKMVREHPVLVAFTVFSKLGIIAGIVAIFANVGLLAALRFPKSWRLDFALLSAIMASALPLILYAPMPLYDVGLISMALIYGIVSVDCAAQQLEQRKKRPWRRSRLFSDEIGGNEVISARDCTP